MSTLLHPLKMKLHEIIGHCNGVLLLSCCVVPVLVLLLVFAVSDAFPTRFRRVSDAFWTLLTLFATLFASMRRRVPVLRCVPVLLCCSVLHILIPHAVICNVNLSLPMLITVSRHEAKLAAGLATLSAASRERVLHRCGVPVVNPLLEAIAAIAAAPTVEPVAQKILPAILPGPGVGPGVLKTMGITKHKAIAAKRQRTVLLEGTGLGRVVNGHIGPKWSPIIEQVSLFVRQPAHSSQPPFKRRQIKVKGVPMSWHFLNTCVTHLYALHQAEYPTHAMGFRTFYRILATFRWLKRHKLGAQRLICCCPYHVSMKWLLRSIVPVSPSFATLTVDTLVAELVCAAKADEPIALACGEGRCSRCGYRLRLAMHKIHIRNFQMVYCCSLIIILRIVAESSPYASTPVQSLTCKIIPLSAHGP